MMHIPFLLFFDQDLNWIASCECGWTAKSVSKDAAKGYLEDHLKAQEEL